MLTLVAVTVAVVFRTSTKETQFPSICLAAVEMSDDDTHHRALWNLPLI